MADPAPPIVKARRYDPRDDETIDLKHFDLIEIQYGHRRFTVRIGQDHAGAYRLHVSGDDRLTIQPVGANWVDILL